MPINQSSQPHTPANIPRPTQLPAADTAPVKQEIAAKAMPALETES